MKNAFNTIGRVIAFSCVPIVWIATPTWATAPVYKHWALDLNLGGSGTSFGGRVGERSLVSPNETEVIGTICGRGLARLGNIHNVLQGKSGEVSASVTLDLGTLAHSRRESAPGVPAETRCILRGRTGGQCQMMPAALGNPQCELNLSAVIFSEVTMAAVGPGWVLEGPKDRPLRAIDLPKAKTVLTLLP